MPARPAARASPSERAARDLGARVGPGIGQDLEGERLQSVARQNGGGFVEGAVGGRLSPPQIVIVHRRQVVMDQRIGVHAFDRRAGAHRPAVRAPERARRLDDEKGLSRFPPPSVE